MRRIEKRKNFLIVGLTLLLLLSIPLTVFQAAGHIKDLTGKDISALTGEYGTITDRSGNVLFDGTIHDKELFGSLISNGMNSNALFNRYRDELAPKGFNYFAGSDSLRDTAGGRITTTLISPESQKLIADAFAGRKGLCFSYNYKTGEIYTALSFPSGLSEADGDGAILNRCLNELYIPGSTMKIVTAACAIAQNPDLMETVHTCNGSYELPDGKTVVCPYNHGNVDFKKAIGVSCNGYFAKIIGQLDLEKALETLRGMGIYANCDAESGKADRLNKVGSDTVVGSTAAFNDVWGLIGQGRSRVNAIDMAMIAGAIANGGETATPYIIESISTEGKKKPDYKAKDAKDVRLLDEDVADVLCDVWTDAFYENYPSYRDVTRAKTGTAQIGDGSVSNRLLIGTIDECDTAFMIIIEEYESYQHLSKTIPLQIAQILKGVLPKSE